MNPSTPQRKRKPASRASLSVHSALWIWTVAVAGALAFAPMSLVAGGDSCTTTQDGSSGQYCGPNAPIAITAEVMDYSKPCWSWYCSTVDGSGPKPFNSSGPGGYACYNSCEYCCFYFFNIGNRYYSPIVRVDMCTDRGCTSSGPNKPIVPNGSMPCDSLDLPQSGVDHFCEYCGVDRRGALWGWGSSSWHEDTTCRRLKPTGVAPDTILGDGWKDSLCRKNCLRLLADNSGHYVQMGDTMRIKAGLTGDCKNRWRNVDGTQRLVKCVWICVTFLDGTQYCCLLTVSHCTCIDGPGCDCPVGETECNDHVGPEIGMLRSIDPRLGTANRTGDVPDASSCLRPAAVSQAGRWTIPPTPRTSAPEGKGEANHGR